MIVRTYARRTRDIGRSFSDPTLLDNSADPQSSQELTDFTLSQESSQDPFKFAAAVAFSSQDSSPWSLEPDLFADHDPIPSRRPAKKSRKKARDTEAGTPAVGATATLMEAQEFGEMMEHVDEVNFAIDGMRPGQPARIRRASLLSLLSICATAQQRRLLRAQGMAKRIIDSILALDFDDFPSTLAAATLFFVLASDVQDDHLLDSPPCIHFLLKLLNPPTTNTIEGKVATIGSKLIGACKPPAPSVINKGMDSSSRMIISKVHEILLSCREIKSGKGDDGLSRPELSSKWISLLTMEKACLSTVSFEDTSEAVRNERGNFKERLRELGGLDAIFDVVISCHSTMERWLKCRSPSVAELKNEVTLDSMVHLLKCLKILENATFLSKDNQDHLLGMRGNINSDGLTKSFVAVIVSSIKVLSALTLLQRASNIGRGGTSACLKQNLGNRTGHKCQRLSAPTPDLSDSGSELISADGWKPYSVKDKAAYNGSDTFDKASNGSNGDNTINTTCLKSHVNSGGSKLNINISRWKAISDNSHKHERGWVLMGSAGLERDSCGQSKTAHVSEDVRDECTRDECTMESYDPFAFDEGEFEPSKWDKLARKKETLQTVQSTVTSKERSKRHDDLSIGTEPVLSQPTDGDSQKSWEDGCASIGPEDSNLLEDCLLASVKVLMNLTNDNPVGCQQIASCGGLDTMVSLITSHFPSYDLCSPLHELLKEDMSSSNQITIAGHMKNKHLTDHGLDFLVAILGLLVNLVEKDSRNRLRLASAQISVEETGVSEIQQKHRDVIPLLCSIFLANQGAGEAAGEGKNLLCDDEALMQGQQEAEMMIVEAYTALLLAFLSTESAKVREAIASCLPNHNLEALVPVLERFVAFHLQLSMISPETHSAVVKVIESCRGP